MTLVVEDGSGSNAAANTYISLADAKTYHEATLYADNWNAANDARKSNALIAATRLIDSEMEFNGWRTNPNSQALEWPRIYCPNTDDLGYTGSLFYSFIGAYVYPSNKIPTRLAQATAEQAKFMLAGEDREADVDQKGIESINLGQSALAVTFDKTTTRVPLTDRVKVLLQPFGHLRRHSGKAYR